MVPLSDHAVTAEVVLRRGVDEAKRGGIAGAIVVKLGEDGGWSIDHSFLTAGELAYAAQALQTFASRALLELEKGP